MWSQEEDPFQPGRGQLGWVECCLCSVLLAAFAQSSVQLFPCQEGHERCAGCGGALWALDAPQTGLSPRHRLSLLERVSAEAVTTTLHQVTRERMEDRCRGEYERSFLREFHKVRTPLQDVFWGLGTNLTPWL